MQLHMNLEDQKQCQLPCPSLERPPDDCFGHLQVSIWRSVAEDFAPFNVDVTTEDPGVEALRKFGTGDTQWGVRVVIGGSSSDWYNGKAGGVAYLTR